MEDDNTMKYKRLIAVALIGCTTALGQETLPPLAGEGAPQTFEATWAGFDPRAEPLEVETLKEWEEDGVMLRVIRFRIGVFNGQKALLAAGYYYGPYTAETYNLSSRMHVATPDRLRADGVQASMKPSLVIETFEGNWRKQWFTYKPEQWTRRTHKLYDDRWQAPANAKLALDVCSAEANKIVVGLDEFAAEIALKGGDQWQSVSLSPSDFENVDGESLPDWDNVKELRLGATETLRAKVRGVTKSRVFGAIWQGPEPEFRNLRWMDGA